MDHQLAEHSRASLPGRLGKVVTEWDTGSIPELPPHPHPPPHTQTNVFIPPGTLPIVLYLGISAFSKEL